MKTELKSLSKIFTEKLLRIPDYQRGYAWEEKQLKDFWHDLISLDNHKSHYVGVLTLEDVIKSDYEHWLNDQWIIESKSYIPYYVVDGQQRLTTSVILIQCITECMNEDQELNYDSVQEIRKKYIFETKDKGISRSYIFGYEKDNPSYDFLKTKIFCEISEASRTPQETIYTHNLAIAKKFFQQKLNTLPLDTLSEIYKKITQKFLFNIYSIAEEVDTFVAFETMNNRGKLLSHLELLKNRLIYLSTKSPEDLVDSKKLRYTINKTWQSIYHFLGKNKDNPIQDDFFLYNHFISYFGSELIKNDNETKYFYFLNRTYKNTYKDFLLDTIFSSKLKITENKKNNKNNLGNSLSLKEIYNYVSDLKVSVEIFYEISNPELSNFNEEIKYYLIKISRLDFSKTISLVMVFFQKTNDTMLRVDFLNILEKHLFIDTFTRFSSFFDISDFEIEALKELSYKLSNDKLTCKDCVKKLKTEYSKITNPNLFVPSIGKNIKYSNSNYYRWKGIRYFMYEYEMYLKSKSDTDRFKLKWEDINEVRDDYDTVEHIYPQNTRKQCWTKHFNIKNLNTEDRKALLNSLGNLLPLSRRKNSSLGNASFHDKKNGRKEKNNGYKYGSYSEIEISENEDWTPEKIINRGIQLLSFLEIRWGISIGSDTDKVNLLGLSSVNKKIKDSITS